MRHIVIIVLILSSCSFKSESDKKSDLIQKSRDVLERKSRATAVLIEMRRTGIDTVGALYLEHKARVDKIQAEYDSLQSLYDAL